MKVTVPYVFIHHTLKLCKQFVGTVTFVHQKNLTTLSTRLLVCRGKIDKMHIKLCLSVVLSADIKWCDRTDDNSSWCFPLRTSGKAINLCRPNQLHPQSSVRESKPLDRVSLYLKTTVHDTPYIFLTEYIYCRVAPSQGLQVTVAWGHWWKDPKHAGTAHWLKPPTDCDTKNTPNRILVLIITANLMGVGRDTTPGL